MSTKSVTAPSWIRSIRLPIAPPASSPIGSQSPRRSDAARNMPSRDREGDRGEHEHQRAGLVQQAEGDPAVADPDDVEAGDDVDPFAGHQLAADDRLGELIERERDERDRRRPPESGA